MTAKLDRRSLLRGLTLVGAAPVVLAATTGQALAAPAADPVSAAAAAAAPAAWKLLPFALDEVSLGKGIFADKRGLMLGYARGYDVDRLLQVFRANAGLDTLGAVAPGGWEGLDGEANGNLRGHYTGHFLTMLAQAYGSTGDAAFADKIKYMIGALTDVRTALRAAPVLLSAPGRFGTAVRQVRGSNQYVNLPATLLAGSAAVTVAAWVKPAHAANWARVFDFGNDTQRYMYLVLRNAGGVPRFAVTTNYAGGEQGINGTTALPLDEWSHVAVTVGAGTGRLYVNGVQVGVNPAMTITPAVLGTLRNNWLGRSNYSGDPVYAGGLDDVNFWSRELSAAEIAGLQAGPAATAAAGAGDLASYGCDETGGGTLTDASPRGQHGTLLRTWGGPSHPGFLAAYPETQFITLESMTGSDYTRVWAPYYTAHKILRGILDAYLNTGDARALDLASGLCDWMYARLSKLPATTLQRMWGLFSSGEFGGIVEAICDVYRITGTAEHLALARLFDLDKLIDSAAAGTDTITNLHANQHIPIFTGLLRLHDETGEQRYLDAARNFWPMVAPARMYSIGGTSTAEFWRAPGAIAATLSDTNAETCCAYNMLKLSRMLFLHEQDPKYMDYYERALYNQVLGSKRDTPDAEKPLVTYFIGLVPGHVRDYTPKQGTTCCEGTGMESATKYQDSVYFAAADGKSLYVNLYSRSQLTWARHGVTLTQTTRYPFEQSSTITVRGRATFDLRLRVPGWARDGFTVHVNGRRVAGEATPGSYFTVSRRWRDGDTVQVRLPFRLRVERALDAPVTQSLFYGPINLVARSAGTSSLPVGLYRNCALSGDLLPSLTPVPGKPLHYTLDGVEFAPFLEGTEDPTHVYFTRSEPTVAFGGTDSGVANPAKSDGTTLLDEIWAGAPFAGKPALVKKVKDTVDAWVGGGLLPAADGATVLATARKARYAC